MAVYFFDSSALVKRYVNEKGTGWVKAIAAQNYIFIAGIAVVEVVSAIERRKRSDTITATDAGSAIAAIAEGFSVEDPNTH